MTDDGKTLTFGLRLQAALMLLALLVATPQGALAQITAFKQAVAETAAEDPALSAFYRETEYEALWTGRDDAKRRTALVAALEAAGDHGLPADRYRPAALRELLAGVRSAADRGRVEVEISRLFLRYAEDIQSGVLDPGSVDAGLVLDPPRRDRLAQIRAFSQSSPAAYMRALPPQSQGYVRLLKEKRRLERLVGQGGWGAPVRAGKLEPGDSGPQVIALRDRLIRMGYMDRSAAAGYDAALQQAVQRFQRQHGLAEDGVAGDNTLAAINTQARTRLQQVIVGLERERWLNKPLGARHILVNQADFHGYVVDDGKVSFETRVVVGRTRSDLRTPEFSDVMEHMVINPTWNVPRSIATQEYLPQLKQNPNAVGHLRLIDARGRVVNRQNVDFTQFNERNFPFDMKQPPSPSNALGLVKFMFPNRYNIYLHDTPQKSLFGRNVRAFSHGCVRVQRPFELAYHLLAPQTPDPKGVFHRALDSGRETQIDLQSPVPVHLTYRTAWVDPKGGVNYRADIYGRDGRIFDALSRAGVALRAIQS